jgi:hypothetical protein
MGFTIFNCTLLQKPFFVSFGYDELGNPLQDKERYENDKVHLGGER